jgi:hypothetical protein
MDETQQPTAEQPVAEALKRKRGRPRRAVGIGRYPQKVKLMTPAKKLAETEEFKAAVADAVARSVTELAERLKESRESHGTAGDASDPSWMRALAMEISQLTDQGTGRKRVAPEILRARQVARERMTKLIIEARAEKKIATYKVRAKTLIADRVVEPFWIASDHSAQPTIIDWDGVPNEAMVPENRTAKAIHEAFMESIGSTVRVVPEDALAITPGGLVVHGGAASISAGKRQVSAAETPQTGTERANESGLNIHHKNEPGRYVEKRILGSIADPARQTV